MSHIRCRLTKEEERRLMEANARDIEYRGRERFEVGCSPRYFFRNDHSSFYEEMGKIISIRGGIKNRGFWLPRDGDGWEFIIEVEDVLNYEI